MPAETFHFFWSGPFSQWHPSVFVLNGVTYSCAEQYMMAEKARLFGDPTREAMILSTSDPAAQKRFGRQVQGFNDTLWRQHAQAIVKRGSLAKYQQNSDLLATLLATHPHTLVEASPSDRIWGIGLTGSDPRAKDRKTWLGHNWLGQILTEVREELWGNRYSQDQPVHRFPLFRHHVTFTSSTSKSSSQSSPLVLFVCSDTIRPVNRTLASPTGTSRPSTTCPMPAEFTYSLNQQASHIRDPVCSL